MGPLLVLKNVFRLPASIRRRQRKQRMIETDCDDYGQRGIVFGVTTLDSSTTRRHLHGVVHKRCYGDAWHARSFKFLNLLNGLEPHMRNITTLLACASPRFRHSAAHPHPHSNWQMLHKLTTTTHRLLKTLCAPKAFWAMPIKSTSSSG